MWFLLITVWIIRMISFIKLYKALIHHLIHVHHFDNLFHHLILVHDFDNLFHSKQTGIKWKNKK